MKVLFAAAECTPFVKTGGLGEVIGSLPKELKKNGVDARVILPKYGAIGEDFRKQMRLLREFTVPLSWRQQYGGIYELVWNGIPYYFIDNEYYFKRDAIYGFGGAMDEGERFAYFSKAVLESILHLDWTPDLLHLHDWQTALIPVFYHAFYRYSPLYEGMKMILTIHNLKYQGVFSSNLLTDVLGIGWEYFTPDRLEYYGNLNFLKGGIAFADAITTVSKSYAEEIQNPYFGEGLDGLLRARTSRLFGIVNGIDYDSYNPEKDLSLPYPYRDNPEEKQKNKAPVQERFHLPVGKEHMMVIMVTRLVEQKGIDLIMRVLPEMMEEDVQLIIFGSGEARYEGFFRHAEHLYPDQLRIHTKYEDELARQLYGAGDLLLMPSRFEPCGISQMIAMRYLTVPLVRETGGLKDTVQAYNPATGEGDGFTFHDYNAHELLYAFRRATQLYKDQEAWGKLLKNLLKKDCSWSTSARSYRELYEKVLHGGGS
ncbi:glycogen synthase GlgA [Thermicanus aegyptius]|uniref:glycogen synthase GlgA n=1 Tax=Thermicanus aegyptius TaxID=94009 RepID=UPI00048DBB07|nr:glycogen synthase GlgA [Thermicanus aegyptius]